MKKIIFEPSSCKFKAIDFNAIDINEYISCFKESIELSKNRIEEIKKESSTNFSNTIEALENCSKELDLTSNIFYNILSTCNTAETQAMASEIGPMLSDFRSSMISSDNLFKKIESVYNNKDNFSLDTEQSKLLEETYTDFVRNGAKLSKDKKERLKQVNSELSKMSPQFSENLLKATNAFELHITHKENLSGIPENICQAAKETAEELKKDGYIFTLHHPSFGPFMKYCSNRELRKEMYMANATKCTEGEFSNKENILKTLALRYEKAQILDFKNYAEYSLQKRMAQNTETVFQFLKDLSGPSLKAAKKEFKELQNFAQSQGGPNELLPWDLSFYSEKLKKEKYNFSEEDLRPYFSLDKCIEGIFKHAEILYNLEFKASEKYPKYHEDVRIYEVHSKDSKKFIGLFYADFFPRKSKRSGAWMTEFKSQKNGGSERPHVSIVCNFTKPTKDEPSLLTFMEVQTLFHEFGHSLHSLLSQCQYSSLSGTNVYWDFVELPSQIFENWILEKESLDLFAYHYKTGKSISKELAEKIKKSSQFMAGMNSLRQLSLGLVDLLWHTTNPSTIKDIEAFEVEAKKGVSLLPHIKGTSTSCSFAHIFSGGYAAGYYSYKWAEVLDADAFELFLEKGIFNKQTAKSFKENILERGGTEHPMNLYKKFRGREPDPKALLRRDGLC